MPANITVTNGKEEMMYVGKTPWHGLGQALDNPATSEQALEAAGLNWEVDTRPLMVPISGDDYAPVLDRIAVVRKDTETVLSLMSEQYEPVQNHEAFRFFDDVVAAGEAIYHTAGSLNDGRRIWILAKLPGELKISDEDWLEKYILLVNSHDGSSAVRMQPTAIRVVCQNTLVGALSERRNVWRAIHRPGVLQRVTEARESLKLQEAHFQLMMRGIERMADTRMESSHTDFYKGLFKLNDDEAWEKFQRSKRMESIENLYVSGRGNNGDTKWDMFNAVTEWVDHDYGRQHNRLNSAWFGVGSTLKRRAWDLLAPELDAAEYATA